MTTETQERRMRRRRNARRISAIIAVVVTIVLALVVYYQSRVLPERIAAYVNRHYLTGTPFEFSLDGVSGSFVREITLKNPVLRYNSPDASYNVFRADRVSVTYQLPPVFAFRLFVDDVVLENVAIHLRQDKEGRLILPGSGVAKEGVPKKKVISPVVDVRQFRIDGLELTYGGSKRELRVRDVELGGSFAYDNGVGRLMIEQGQAYLINSRTTVSSIRLAARSDWRSIFVEDFAVKLDSSFVMAKGEFREGRFESVDLLFKPVSLEELHQLGVIPDEHGTFEASLSLSGTVDSLGVTGVVTGEGLGVALDNVELAGRLTPQELDLRRLNGKVFGSSVDGAFRINLDSEDFVFDGRVDDLDLSRGFIEDSDLPPMSLTGNVRVECKKDAGRYAWSGHLERAVVDGYETFDLSAAGTWADRKGLTIDRFSTTRPSYRLEGSGTVADGGPAAIVFRAEGTDFSYFWNYFELPPIGGGLSLNGRIEGPLDDFTVNLNGTVHNLAWEFARVDSGSVQAEARHLGTEAPEVTLALGSRRARIYDVPVQNTSLLMEVDTSAVHIHDVRVMRSDSTFAADLDVVTRDGRSRIEVARARLETPHEEWRTASPAVIYASDEGVATDSLVFVSGRGEFGVSGSRRVVNQEIDTHVWGRNVDLAVFRDALRLPMVLGGRGTFDLYMEGSQDNPRARLTTHITQGMIDSVAFDALSADASYDGTRYRLARLWMRSGDDTLSATGEWACAAPPQKLLRDDRPESMWAAPMSARVYFGQYDLSALFRAMHQSREVASAYTGWVTVGGTLDQPRLRAQGAFQRLMTRGMVLPPARVDAEYRDGAVRVAKLEVSDIAGIEATGTFPTTVSFRSGARILSDTPMEASIDIKALPDDALSNLGPYLPGVSVFRGVVTGHIDAAGTPRDPRLTGAVSLARGEIRHPGVQETVTNVSARIDLVGDLMRLTSLSAASGKKGSFVGTGWARVSNYRLADYEFDVTARDFPIRSIQDVEIVLGGAVKVRLKEWRDGSKIPVITGAVAVKEANIYKELTSSGSAGTAFLPTDRPNWIASIDIDAPNNVWIRNPDLNVELSADDLVFIRDELGMYFRGELTVLRGSYNLYGNKFTITSGTMDFSASETLRPSMHIEAYTRHRSSDGDDNNIYLVLQWPYNKAEPQISLSYDEPGYSESDIWAMLGGNIFAGGVATNALERAINAQMAGGFTVDVEQRSYEDAQSPVADQETLIGVGKYLWEDIYLQYRRGLSVGGEQEVNVEYRLSNRLLLRSQVIYNSRRNRSGIAGQNTDEYNLDLKYRFEY